MGRRSTRAFLAPADELLPPLGGKAAGAALGADYYVRPALAAASDADRVFEALHSVRGSEASLHCRLAYVGR